MMLRYKIISAPSAELNSALGQNRQENPLYICPFMSQHLFGTLFAVLFCSDADNALFGAIWDNFH
jgi:hypothetical protein